MQALYRHPSGAVWGLQPFRSFYTTAVWRHTDRGGRCHQGAHGQKPYRWTVCQPHSFWCGLSLCINRLPASASNLDAGTLSVWNVPVWWLRFINCRLQNGYCKYSNYWSLTCFLHLNFKNNHMNRFCIFYFIFYSFSKVSHSLCESVMIKHSALCLYV